MITGPIVVGVDGSPESGSAASVGWTVARAAGVGCQLVHAAHDASASLEFAGSGVVTESLQLALLTQARATVQPTEAADPLSGDPSTPTTIGPVIMAVSFPFYITVASCGSAFTGHTPAVTATGATSNEVGRCLISRSVTLPSNTRCAHPLPCEPPNYRSA